MRETFISILALLAIAPCTKCSDIGKDGFNFYKDYLRARTDDVMSEGPASGERMLYHMLSKELWSGDSLGKRGSKTAISLIMQGKHPYYATESPRVDNNMEPVE
ncbi:unnamed protein product [Spodoptera exigua]|nr:unnamed protein product [Spodoptera exigua]